MMSYDYVISQLRYYVLCGLPPPLRSVTCLWQHVGGTETRDAQTEFLQIWLGTESAIADLEGRKIAHSRDKSFLIWMSSELPHTPDS